MYSLILLLNIDYNFFPLENKVNESSKYESIRVFFTVMFVLEIKNFGEMFNWIGGKLIYRFSVSLKEWINKEHVKHKFKISISIQRIH